MLEDVCLIPGAGQNCPLPLLLPPHIQIEGDLLNGGPCPAWRSGKSSSCGEFSTHKLLLSVNAVVGVELLAKTFAGKHIATVLQRFVLVRHWKRLDSPVTDITWVIPLSPMDFVLPH